MDGWLAMLYRLIGFLCCLQDSEYCHSIEWLTQSSYLRHIKVFPPLNLVPNITHTRAEQMTNRVLLTCFPHVNQWKTCVMQCPGVVVKNAWSQTLLYGHAVSFDICFLPAQTSSGHKWEVWLQSALAVHSPMGNGGRTRGLCMLSAPWHVTRKWSEVSGHTFFSCSLASRSISEVGHSQTLWTRGSRGSAAVLKEPVAMETAACFCLGGEALRGPA